MPLGEIGRSRIPIVRSRRVKACYRANPYVALRPNRLRFIAGIERDQMTELGGPAGKPAFVLGDALRDLTRLNEGIPDVGDEIAAAHREAER
jgi:hypothetical protein